MILALFACADPEALTVAVTDARTGRAVAGVAVQLSGEGCPAEPLTTDDDGELDVPEPCRRAKASVVDEAWSAEPVEGGGALGVQAWPAPPHDGVWLVDGATTSPVLTNTALDELPLLGGAGSVRLPVEIPGGRPTLTGARELLLAGDAAAAMVWEPLVQADARRFGPDATPVPVAPWVYLGVRFVDDRTVERVDAALDAAKVVRATVAGRPLAWIPATALSPGTYALSAPGSRRAVVVEVTPTPG